ncbi:MAG: hypothetical protein H7338_04020 [Candidatus Sericytochromatia bacterium]|nr:hypothetical protein [Candidatus Sericytochromatia bacterium]
MPEPDTLPRSAALDAASFRLGVNYWPAQSAMGWWQQMDLAAAATDFARMRQAGCDSVRLFLLWEDFQPQPMTVDATALGHLVCLADLAAEAGIQLMPTLFTGHMSGVNWIPAWALGGSDGDKRFRIIAGGASVTAGLLNWFTDETVLASQVLLAHTAAEALKGHPALWAWDLGNENSNCVIPPSREAGLAWLARITGAIRAADPTARITIGLHMEDLEEDRGIGPAEAAAHCDFLCMHGYPIYADWSAGPTDELLLPFLAAITRWLGGGAEVLFAEFGLPTRRPGDPVQQQYSEPMQAMLVDELAAAAYVGRALKALHTGGSTGALLWCYADYAQALWDQPPFEQAVHERHFGLWRADASPKPVVAEITAYAGHIRITPPDAAWIDLAPADFYAAPKDNLKRLYARFRKQH